MHETLEQTLARLPPTNEQIKDADLIVIALEHLVRARTIDGYDKLFRQRFSERAKLNGKGLVNLRELARDVCQEMGVADPLKKLE